MLPLSVLPSHNKGTTNASSASLTMFALRKGDTNSPGIQIHHTTLNPAIASPKCNESLVKRLAIIRSQWRLPAPMARQKNWISDKLLGEPHSAGAGLVSGHLPCDLPVLPHGAVRLHPPARHCSHNMSPALCRTLYVQGCAQTAVTRLFQHVQP